MNNNQFPFQQQPPLGYGALLENKPIFLQQPSTTLSTTGSTTSTTELTTFWLYL
jgi:hypothetical protein